ncbi:MAG: tyrosine-protein phosphatase [Erysipelotrichaceae bacterium]|nr:tyrosine-protein phosphatase [Erysipelotrichaceae bacterium]
MGYIRDLGGLKTIDGKTIKANCLFRSAQLDKPSKEQISFLNDIKLKRIIDLRTVAEADQDKDIEIEGCKYINIPYVETDYNGVVHNSLKEQLRRLKEIPTMEETYVDMAKNDFCVNKIKQSLREVVLVHDYPTIIHCATGKDRAGVLTALLLSLLDVPYETIMEDYLKQYPFYLNIARRYGFVVFVCLLDKTMAKKVYDYYIVKREYLDLTMNAFKERFGSLDNFFHEFVGLTDEDIKEFKDIILTN